MSSPPSQRLAAFTYDALPGRVVFGVGRARTDLVAEVERLGMRRVLLITNGREAARAGALAAPLGAGLVASFPDVRPHVPEDVAAAAAALAGETQADGLLAVGGGSATGTAKAVALATGLPILAVPTTYAGSEMTSIWGKTADGRKTTGRADVVLPKVVLYDPELTYSLPADVTAASGMNAIAHCVEALYAPGANPVTSVIAEEAIGALAGSIPTAVVAPKDSTARSAALYGSCLAGSAFAVAGSGLHHKICHVLGGAFDLPHAETHSVVLPHVVAFQQRVVPELMDRVAVALDARPGAAAVTLYGLAERTGIPLGLRDIGAPAGEIDSVVEPVLASLPPNTPGAPTADDVRAILHAAFVGAAPAGVIA